MVEWALKLEGDLAVRPVGGSAQHSSLLFYLPSLQPIRSCLVIR